MRWATCIGAVALVACRAPAATVDGRDAVAPAQPPPAASSPGVVDLPLAPGPDGDWCSVASSRPAPYAVTLRLHNSGPTPVYLTNRCGGSLRVWSCDHPELANVVPQRLCTCSCDDPGCTGPVACDQCAGRPWDEVPPGGVREVPWDGLEILDQSRGMYLCHARAPANAGFYRITVGVEDAPIFPVLSPSARYISRNFVLPLDGDVLDIELADLPPPPAPPGLTTVEPCTGQEALGPSERLLILGVEADGRILKLRVRHLGCRDDHYSSCFGPNWLYSNPPQKGLGLVRHAAGGCTDLITRDVALDLSPLIDAFHRTGEGHSFLLNIGDHQVQIRD